MNMVARGGRREVSVGAVLLAAGAGRRFGRPKVLVDDWLADRLDAVLAGGCRDALVVLGAAAEEARELVPDGIGVVVARDWALGMAASLRAGLRGAADSGWDAALIALVDTPGLTSATVGRVLAAGVVAPRAALVRAAYHGSPGHPVLLGRHHWVEAAASARGDQGAREYLAGREVTFVECGDVGHGEDVDAPPGTSDR